MMHTSDAPGSSSRSEVLIAEDLQKSYGPRPALRGLSFSLKAGRILGFLGPNGAGKTTAIRILTTILEPDSGHFVVDGIGSDDPDRIRRRIGVLPESLGFPKHMTGIEFVTYFGRLYGRIPSDARATALALLEDVGLQQRAKSLVGTYSRGMRQRLGIARALVNDPAVVFLDEPTLGLDPRGQEELLALVRWIARERNAGVVLCSHLLTEVENVCDDVVILSSGQVVAQGSVTEVTGQAQRNGIRIRIPLPSVAEAQQILAAMPDVVKVIHTNGMAGWLRVELVKPADDARSSEDHHCEPPSALARRLSRPRHVARFGQSLVTNRILDALIRAEIPILSFEAAGGRLQNVFLQLTGGAIE